VALDLQPDYFKEHREAIVVEEIRNNAPLREELYDRLQSQFNPPKPTTKIGHPRKRA
jgi:hypothetical protein